MARLKEFPRLKQVKKSKLVSGPYTAPERVYWYPWQLVGVVTIDLDTVSSFRRGEKTRESIPFPPWWDLPDNATAVVTTAGKTYFIEIDYEKFDKLLRRKPNADPS